MFSMLSPAVLARRSARHPWLTLVAWVAIIAASVVAASTIKFNEEWTIKGSDSLKAEQRLQDLHGGDTVTETVVVQSSGATVDDPAYRAFVTDLATAIRGLTGTVRSASTYYDSADADLVSADRTKTLISVKLAGSKVDAVDSVGPLVKLLDAPDTSDADFTVLRAGDGSIGRDFNESAEKDLKAAEYIGLPAALLVLVLVFGAAVAAGVPVALGLLGILVAVGVTALVSQFFGVSSVTVNMITMIGLAVGIDYTLFIVERFREERARGMAKIEAIVMASSTASRAVVFSGITVIIALTGLLIVPSTAFQGMALGAIAVVAAAILIALTLLPAMLSLLDGKVNWLHLPGRGTVRTDAGAGGFWRHTTAAVMRHPLVAAGVSVGILLVLAAPVFAMKLGNSGISQMPQDLNSVRAFNVLQRDFSAGRVSPVDVVIDGRVSSPEVERAIARVRERIAADPAFGEMTDISKNNAATIAAFSVAVNGDPSEPAARDTVERLRSDYVADAFRDSGAHVYVGGQSASTNDYVGAMTEYLPVVITFVLTLSFLLLMVVFRSIVIPAKAIVMNLLSVGAAYGLLVTVFQYGIGADLLGFHESDAIDAFLPVFLFAVLFGLSMDYHVFLLSRIQERHDETGDNAAAVAHGLRSTAHIITGAAAIMITVFGGFALGDMVALQQMGFGLAVAVFLDATIVRSVLVPASMAMLGEWNWYLPSWLTWLPSVSVDGAPHEARPVSREFAPAFAASGGD